VTVSADGSQVLVVGVGGAVSETVGSVVVGDGCAEIALGVRIESVFGPCQYSRQRVAIGVRVVREEWEPKIVKAFFGVV